jgi:hypothetical protein
MRKSVHVSNFWREEPGGGRRSGAGVGKHGAARPADGASLVTSAIERERMTPERYQKNGRLFDEALELLLMRQICAEQNQVVPMFDFRS